MDATPTPTPTGQPFVGNVKSLSAQSIKSPRQVLNEKNLAPKPMPKPTNWWTLSGVAGSLAGVSKIIDDDASISPHWKEVLKAELKYFCDKNVVNFVSIDAHYHATPAEYSEEDKHLTQAATKEEKRVVLNIHVNGKNIAL